MKKRLNDDVIIKSRPTVCGVNDLFHIFLDINIEKFDPAQLHLGTLPSQFFSVVFFQILMSEDVPIALHELVRGQYVLLVVSGQKNQISQLLLVERGFIITVLLQTSSSILDNLGVEVLQPARHIFSGS